LHALSAKPANAIKGGSREIYRDKRIKGGRRAGNAMLLAPVDKLCQGRAPRFDSESLDR
jgi:hypothetical protein